MRSAPGLPLGGGRLIVAAIALGVHAVSADDPSGGDPKRVAVHLEPTERIAARAINAARRTEQRAPHRAPTQILYGRREGTKRRRGSQEPICHPVGTHTPSAQTAKRGGPSPSRRGGAARARCRRARMRSLRDPRGTTQPSRDHTRLADAAAEEDAAGGGGRRRRRRRQLGRNAPQAPHRRAARGRRRWRIAPSLKRRNCRAAWR